MSKDKAKDEEITKKKEGDDKEFADNKMAVEGTKATRADDKTAARFESISIDQILPTLRGKAADVPQKLKDHLTPLLTLIPCRYAPAGGTRCVRPPQPYHHSMNREEADPFAWGETLTTPSITGAASTTLKETLTLSARKKLPGI